MSNDPRTFDEKLREIIISEFKPGIDPHLIFETILSSLAFQGVQATVKFLPTNKMRKQKLTFILNAAFEQWHKQNQPKLHIVPKPDTDHAQN